MHNTLVLQALSECFDLIFEPDRKSSSSPAQTGQSRKLLAEDVEALRVRGVAAVRVNGCSSACTPSRRGESGVRHGFLELSRSSGLNLRESVKSLNRKSDPSPRPSPLRKGNGGIVGSSLANRGSEAGRSPAAVSNVPASPREASASNGEALYRVKAIAFGQRHAAAGQTQ